MVTDTLDAMTDSEQPHLPDLVRELSSIIGRNLTAYAGGVCDVLEVDRWIAGEAVGAEAEQRLRALHRVVQMLRGKDTPEVIQAWLMGLNPELGDRAPLRVLRDEPLETASTDVLSAARAFLIGG